MNYKVNMMKLKNFMRLNNKDWKKNNLSLKISVIN